MADLESHESLAFEVSREGAVASRSWSAFWLAIVRAVLIRLVALAYVLFAGLTRGISCSIRVLLAYLPAAFVSA